MVIGMYVHGLFAPLFALCLILRFGSHIGKFQRADQLILGPELDFFKVGFFLLISLGRYIFNRLERKFLIFLIETETLVLQDKISDIQDLRNDD